MDNLYAQVLLGFAIIASSIWLKSIPMDIIIYDRKNKSWDKLYTLKHWSMILVKLLVITLSYLGAYYLWEF